MYDSLMESPLNNGKLTCVTGNAALKLIVSAEDKSCPKPAVAYTLGGVPKACKDRFVSSPRMTPPLMAATPGTVMVWAAPAVAKRLGPAGSTGTVSKLMSIVDALARVENITATRKYLCMLPPESSRQKSYTH
jgi:hypothetical protein